MRKEIEFTPELGLFIFFISILAFIGFGFIYLWIIRLQGMTVTSWWRTPGKNLDVGGVSDSFHLIGLAWDVIPVNIDSTNKLKALGLKVINEGDHLHAQIL